MSFLRLGALWALPLVLLPILIHLLHRRRHPTAPWAAMMFLQRAALARRGSAKLRRWLILITRTLVVAAVLLALARPLSSGAFGVAASRVGSAATTIVLLDRSPSMQRRVDGGETRQVSGLRSLVATLKTLGAGSVVLFDSVSTDPIEIGSADALLKPMFTGGADSSADVPRMLRDALIRLEQSDQKVADVWVCSDRQQHDWQIESPLWKQVAELAEDRGAGVRFHLLRFPADQAVNASVTVTRSRWVESTDGKQLAVSIKVTRDDQAPTVVPVSVTIGGVTSVVDVEVVDGVGQLSDKRLDSVPGEGTVYGQVSIPADVNAADDQWFFTVVGDQNHRLGLVTETSCLALDAASGILGNRVFSSVSNSSDGVGQGGRLRTASQSLTDVASLVWQGNLPDGDDAMLVTQFLEQGGSVIFFPPQAVERDHEFHGVRWGQWNRGEIQQAAFDEWEFQIASHCKIVGEVVRLSSTLGNDVLAGKVRVGKGAAWFCGMDVIDSESLFVKNGLVLYGLLSEAIDASALDDVGDGGIVAGQIDQGGRDDLGDSLASSRVLMSRSDSIEFAEVGHHGGVLMIAPFQQSQANQSQAGQGQGRLVAINRSLDESLQQQVDVTQLGDLAAAIDWNQVSVTDDQSESGRGFVREIWGVVWVVVIAGMLCEAWLSMPARARGTSR